MWHLLVCVCVLRTSVCVYICVHTQERPRQQREQWASVALGTCVRMFLLCIPGACAYLHAFAVASTSEQGSENHGPGLHQHVDFRDGEVVSLQEQKLQREQSHCTCCSDGPPHSLLGRHPLWIVLTMCVHC